MIQPRLLTIRLPLNKHHHLPIPTTHRMRQDNPQIPRQVFDMLDRIMEFDVSDLHEQELRDGSLERGEFETGAGLLVAERVLELGC